MASFALQLLSATRAERIEAVTAFQGEDATGRFGIRPGHERFITSLAFGLAAFQQAGGQWEYLALPGGLLYFTGGELILTARNYVRDVDSGRISAALDAQLRAEERTVDRLHVQLARMEQELMRRLHRLDERSAA
jgi:F-type H+-transporting ATPase subunit epsilon